MTQTTQAALLIAFGVVLVVTGLPWPFAVALAVGLAAAAVAVHRARASKR